MSGVIPHVADWLARESAPKRLILGLAGNPRLALLTM
jgi:hypothetical protein